MMRFVLVFFCLASAEVFACGSSVTNLIPGSKVAGIQLSDRSNRKFFVLDDDGALAGTLAIAYCNEGIPSVRIEMTEAQNDCAYRAQEHLPHSERLNSYSRIKNTDATAVSALKKACNFDMSQMWAEAEDKILGKPLQCAPKVRAILRRAADRAMAYAKELEETLKKANLPSKEVATRVLPMLKTSALLGRAATAVEKPNVTMKEFGNAIENIEDHYKTHGYQVVNAMEDVNKMPRKQMLLGEVLAEVNASLPNIPLAKCGQRIGEEVLQVLNKINWQTAEGAQGGTTGR